MLSGHTNIKCIHNMKSRAWCWFWKDGFSTVIVGHRNCRVRPHNRVEFEDVGVPVFDY